jgi:hypothetical protein
VIEHPRAERLEALAAGDDDAAASGHLEQCSACRAHVAELRAAAEQFAATAPKPEVFARRVAARARGGTHWLRWRPLVAVAPALLTAAALVLFVRARSEGPPATGPGTEGSVRVVDTVRFKGAGPLSVIRERGGAQDRFAGKVAVKPGDALRLEVALDAEAVLAAGLLGEDGSVVELIAPKRLGPGTHFSELAARFDEHPVPGWLIAGDPASIERAKRERAPLGASALRVELE